MTEIVGEFTLEKEDNFDNYLKAMGVSFLVRKTVCFVSNTIVIQKNGDDWYAKSSTPFKSMEQRFKSGVEVEEHWPDGSHLMAVHVIKDNTWNSDITSINIKGLKSRVEREFNDEGMVETSVTGSVKSTRRFIRKKK